MSKATEAKLGDLHGAVTDLLTEVIRNGKTIGTDESGEPIKATAPAAYVVAALALLKNNNITADPSTNEGLRTLQEQLAARRKTGKSSLGADALQEAMGQLDRDLGDMMQ